MRSSKIFPALRELLFGAKQSTEMYELTSELPTEP